MAQPVGLAVTLRVRIGADLASHADGLVDPARILALFGDVASELMIRLDGDEGTLRGYQQVEILAPVFVGDYIEATGVITKLSGTTRQIAFEARKVVAHLRPGPSTAADALADPIIVCRAVGSSMVPRAQQRRPRLVLPALPATASVSAQGRLPEGHVVVTPPPHVIVTPPRETSPEVMIAASIVGGGVTREHTPHIPVTPEEVAAEAKRCRDAGASVIYLSLATQGTDAAELSTRARDMVDAIHAQTDAVVVVSMTAPGADLSMRLAGVASGAELVAFTGGSFNLGDAVVETSRPRIREIASAIGASSARPLVECFDAGHIDEAMALWRAKLLNSPLCLQLVLGVPGSMGAHDDVVQFVARRVPRNSVWFAAGVGRHQRSVTEMAMRLGGHVRLGLADNLYMRRGVLAEGSAPFIEKAAAFANSIGRQPVDPTRARVLLGFVKSAEPTNEPSPQPPLDTPAGAPPAPAAEPSAAEQSSAPAESGDK